MTVMYFILIYNYIFIF